MQNTHTIIIDIGNSRVKYYAFERVFLSINELFEFISAQGSIDGDYEVFLVSTAQGKNQKIIDELKDKLKITSLKVFLANEQTEIKEVYEGLGEDRIAKLIGAAKLFPQKNIILMDFGTATTISVLDKDRNFKGGFIGLGMRSSLKALAEYCDALADFSCDPELGVLIDNYDQKAIYEHKSTKQAILLGAVNSHLALINQWIYRAKKLLDTERDIITICTGGEAGYFEKFFDKRIEDSGLLTSCFQKVKSPVSF